MKNNPAVDEVNVALAHADKYKEWRNPHATALTILSAEVRRLEGEVLEYKNKWTDCLAQAGTEAMQSLIRGEPAKRRERFEAWLDSYQDAVEPDQPGGMVQLWKCWQAACEAGCDCQPQEPHELGCHSTKPVAKKVKDAALLQIVKTRLYKASGLLGKGYPSSLANIGDAHAEVDMGIAEITIAELTNKEKPE